MGILINILKLFAGIGLFLFAMYLIEESLKNLAGRNFKLFLQRITKNNLGAVAGGTVVTAVLQSSSMISLMVLAFVGAGVFTLKNAMGIILGANLGTTIDSWLVATLGFKVNIEVAAYPAVFIGGFILILFGNRKMYKYLSYFLFGFGLLFIGLSFMKTAMEAQVKTFDFSLYAELPLVAFLVMGFIITLLVQSSSVTMALTLSAIHAGAVGFPAAAAIVLGSETGTTIKIMVSSIGGNASKKRVATGNFLFNVILTLIAFIFLKSILLLINDVFRIEDPLIGLVTFSSLVNLFGVVIFLPFLNRFTKLLETFYKETDNTSAAFISHANVTEPETALDLFQKETEYFIHNSILFNLGQFEIDISKFAENPDFKIINEKRNFFSKSQDEKYKFLKELQGELQSFYIRLRTHINNGHDKRLNQLISALRNSMHSVKSIKDIGSNISNLRRSSKDIKFNFFISHRKETEDLYHQLILLLKKNEGDVSEEMETIFNTIQHNYNSALNNFYKKAQDAKIEDIDITTAINFNRELYTSNKAMLSAARDYLAKENSGEHFSN